MNRDLKKFNNIYSIFWVVVSLFLAWGCAGNRHDKEFDSVPDEMAGSVTKYGADGYVVSNRKLSKMPLVQPSESDANTENGSLKRIPVRDIGSLKQVLNDSNATQLEAAKRIGIEPIEDIRGAYRTRRPVVKIISGDNYEVDELKHSLPFLVPEAAALLSDIGRCFNDSLKSRGGSGYRIKVTSLLRTPQTVSRLRRVNRNATEVSTHQYATTFDISYTKFHKYGDGADIHDGDLKNLLAEILYNLRGEGRCYVKFERHTSCFHITCR